MVTSGVRRAGSTAGTNSVVCRQGTPFGTRIHLGRSLRQTDGRSFN
jgi:hypothetical protein